MELHIVLCLDNAAFDNFAGEEVARILRKAALLMGEKSKKGLPCLDGQKLRDINGNTVGKLTFSD